MRKGRIFLVIFLIIILLFLNLSNLKGEDEKDYLFHVNIILPTSNSVRMGYSSLLVDQFAKIGIEAELDMLSMTAFIPRVLEQVVGPYMNGGYDIALFGVTVAFMIVWGSLWIRACKKLK